MSQTAGNGRATRVSTDVVVRQMGDSAVLVDLRTNHIFELNATSMRLWDLLGRGLSDREIVARLIDEFDVAEPEAARDLADLLALLEEAGLLA
jgi:Coenzyme PQQ synthesis protein D (PqqD)